MTIPKDEATIPTDDATIRSGVSLAIVSLANVDDVAEIARGHADACDEFVSPLDPASGVACTFAIASGAGPVGVLVRLVPPEYVAARPEIAALLDAPVRTVVRLETFVRAEAPAEALRVEAIVAPLAADLLERFGGVAVDDAGAIYEPGELATLARAGKLLIESDAFARAAARRVTEVENRTNVANDADEPIDVARPIDGEPPADTFPDVSTAFAVAFVVAGRRLPILTATRLAIAANAAVGDATQPRAVVFAPHLDERERAILARANVAAPRDPAAFGVAMGPANGAVATRPPAIVRSTKERDELIVFATETFDRRAAEELVTRRVVDVAVSAGRGATDGPALAESVSPATRNGTSDLPVLLGTFAFDGALASVYHLDLRTAHPLLAELFAARTDVAALLGSAPRYALACELVADPNASRARRDAALESADAFAISLAADVAAREAATVADGSGALFGPAETIRLAAARLGRSSAWSERVALAILDAP